ncbi:type IV pilus biogenesis/stability protein PilW [Halomonas campisalis]|uniref:Type IV pilus biogenesis/stability protein PilW n=1 Tax=Billgrantia campisalis TaxID=74661 RepID=A0ABS9P9V2_9GAMM|nr:type IV pilus biogenesis/stability protein PilW [Halomonas campisalis]MCG6658548.1 type IV pilus biogenesis/stability protein PilW [Halomonas campisalis]MDR5863409.1 type IV pilus biogenesis/stability protein PilW [Halomonas campisalis]
MTRCPPLPHRPTPLRLAAILAGALWLGGCAAQGERTGDAAGPAEAYTQLGMAYLERDNLSRAMSALDRALEIAPNSPAALQAMAIVYQRQGEHELADTTFQRALRADPDFTRARNNYAAYLYDRGRTREACEQLEQASRDTQYASRGQLFANLGQCQWELGDAAAARTSLERAQAINPRHPRSYFALAELELSKGNLERAQRQLEGFMRLAGSTPEAQALARDLAAARGGPGTVSRTLESPSGAP